MLSSLFEMFSKPITDDAIGWAVLVLLWLLLLVLVGMIFYGILSLINYSFLPVKEGYGTITATYFEPAHYTTTYVYNAATKTSMPMQTWHPNAWKWIISVDGISSDWYVSDKDYVKHQIGESLRITYTNGRLWKSLFIKSVYI